MCVRVFDIWCAWYIMCVVVLSYKAEYFCLCQKNIVFFIFFFQSSFSSTWFISGARERYLCYYFSLSPFIRCSLRSRLCLLYLSVELFIFVTRYGKNDVCQFLAYLYYPRETFRITLASLHCPLFRSQPCVPCARRCLRRHRLCRDIAGLWRLISAYCLERLTSFFLYKAGVAAIFGPGTPVAYSAKVVMQLLMQE